MRAREKLERCAGLHFSSYVCDLSHSPGASLATRTRHPDAQLDVSPTWRMKMGHSGFKMTCRHQGTPLAKH